MSNSIAPPLATDTRMRRVALPLLFLLVGVIFASWVSRIPALRDHLQLDPASLSLFLLGGGIGAVSSFPLAAWLVGHYGARRACWYAGVALLLTIPCLALAPSLPILMLAMLCLGVCSSCFNVAINTLGAEAEKVAGRSIMSQLHAWYCVGTLCGALLGSAIAGMGIGPLLHFCVVAICALIPLRLCYRSLPNDRPQYIAGKKHFAMPHGPLIALGAVAFGGAIVEGSVADWSGVYLKDQLFASDGVAPLAFAFFSGMMLLTRIVGDKLKEAFGARRIVASGAAAAGIGMLIALVASDIPLAIAGFALTGVGVATVFPFLFSAAGRHGPTALAGVTTMGYTGGLIGPPAIGFIAHGFGLTAALSMVGVLCAAVAVAASRAKWLE